MLNMNMPWKDLPLFIVLNYKDMYQGGDFDKYNTIILNSIEVDELIERLSKDKDKSRVFVYWLCFMNTTESIDNMRKLVNWMNDNNFKYQITDEQLKMYYETAINTKPI